jgi:hypothetical protein
MHILQLDRRTRKSLVHEQWTTHNEVLHARTEKGIKVSEAAALESAIDKQFSLHTNGLLPQDRHLIDNGCIAVDQINVCYWPKNLVAIYHYRP